MRRITEITLGLTLLCGSALGQIRVEPLLPRLSPAPLVVVAPSILAPAPLLAPAPVLAAAPSLSAAPAMSAAPAPIAADAAIPAAAAAAADGPVPAKSALSAAAKAVPANDDELSARSINVFWDGFASPDRVEVTLLAPSAAGLAPEAARAGSVRTVSAAPWLVLKDGKYSSALDAAVRLARSTRSGRRAFAAAEKALDGANLPVEVLDLGRNWGEFDYLDGRLRLDRKLFAPGREADLAGTLAHELLHLAQHAQGLPSNALELEIEAHLLSLEMSDELGLKTPPRTFARQAQEALAESPEAFIELLQNAVPGSPYLGDTTFAEIIDQLEENLDAFSEKKGARSQKLAAIVAQDIRTLKSPKGRAAYKAFSRRVLAELARRSAAAKN